MVGGSSIVFDPFLQTRQRRVNIWTFQSHKTVFYKNLCFFSNVNNCIFVFLIFSGPLCRTTLSLQTSLKSKPLCEHEILLLTFILLQITKNLILQLFSYYFQNVIVVMYCYLGLYWPIFGEEKSFQEEKNFAKRKTVNLKNFLIKIRLKKWPICTHCRPHPYIWYSYKRVCFIWFILSRKLQGPVFSAWRRMSKISGASSCFI